MALDPPALFPGSSSSSSCSSSAPVCRPAICSSSSCSCARKREQGCRDAGARHQHTHIFSGAALRSHFIACRVLNASHACDFECCRSERTNLDLNFALFGRHAVVNRWYVLEVLVEVHFSS
jgi:hypothetical protein